MRFSIFMRSEVSITRAHQYWDWGWLTLPTRKRVTGPYLSFLPLLSTIGMQFAVLLAHGHCVLGGAGVYRLGETWEKRRSLCSYQKLLSMLGRLSSTAVFGSPTSCQQFLTQTLWVSPPQKVIRLTVLNRTLVC